MDDKVRKNVEGSGRSLLEASSLKTLRETTKNLSQDSHPPGRDLKSEPPE
jgi:hypothetical protein